MKNLKMRFNPLFILLFFFANLGNAQTSYFETSTPEVQGMSSLNILKFIDRLETEIDAVHSFMIIRHGQLVSQGWWDPYEAASPHTMMSLSKSFVSTAVGFAVQELLISLDDLVISFSQINYRYFVLAIERDAYSRFINNEYRT